MPGRPFYNQMHTALRRIPPPLALVVGVLIGLLVARWLPWSSVRLFFSSQVAVGPDRDTQYSPPSWRGAGTHASGRQTLKPQSRHSIALPTIAQRQRVFELLTSLSQHNTKECTRHAQPLYVEQVKERYASLVGHRTPSTSHWFGRRSDDADFGRRDVAPNEHKYFFAINLYNSFDVIPDLFATLFRVSAILGYHNVFVSIYENGSTDQTKALLRIFDALTRSVGLRVVIRTSMRQRGAFNHRIEYLAEVRNAAFVPLHELRDAENEFFDTIIFMNDILPCVDDLLELIWQSRRNNAGITCAADYMYHEELVRPFPPFFRPLPLIPVTGHSRVL